MLEEKQSARMNPSEWLAITKYFPNATFDADQKSWMVTKFDGDNEDHPILRKAIANIISRTEIRNLDEKKAKRQPDRPAENGDSKSAFEVLAAEYGYEEESSQQGDDEEQPTGMVKPHQVKLRIPNEAKIKLYPRSLRCDTCGFYMIARDLGKMQSLTCTNCKKGRMRQLSLLFFCDRCGWQQEIVPVKMDPDKDGPTFDCDEDGCNGKLLLHMKEKLTDMHWVCSVTNHDREVRYMCRFCSNFTTREFKRMDLVATTESYLRPLTNAFVYFGNARRTDIDDEDISWMLSRSNLPEEHKQLLREYGIDEVKVIESVESVIAVYGYSPYGDDVKVRFFKERSHETSQYEYLAYITKTKGKGMLVELDKKKVAVTVLEEMRDKLEMLGRKGIFLDQVKAYSDRLKKEKGDVDEVYQWLLEKTKEILTSESEDEKKLLTGLFKLLHSIEHLLSYQAAIVTGLEENSFSGMVMLEKCAILIYERANVGAGGIDYIYKEKLMEWVNEAVSYVRDCRYDCSDGCVKCLYIRDPMCHPFWPNEIDAGYMVPNSLLSRELTNIFWGLPAPGGVPNDGS